MHVMAAVEGNVKHTDLRTSSQEVTAHSNSTPRWIGGLYTPVSDIKPFDVWHIISYGPKSSRELKEDRHRRDNSPDIGNWQAVEEVSPASEKKISVDNRVPILGPTRQQTEMYFKNLCKKKRHKLKSSHSLEASSTSNEKSHRQNFLSRSAGTNITNRSEENEGCDDDSVSTIEDFYDIAGETVSMLESSDRFKDLRFVSNLVNVKPLRYRIKNNFVKERIIFPSKYGFHPRSHSPTFKRLIGVTEKLQNLQEEGIEHKRLQDPFNGDLSNFKKKSFRLPHPDTNNQKLPFIKCKSGAGNANKEVKLSIPKDFPIKEEFVRSENDIDDKVNSDNESNESEVYFKVECKEEETLPELHLFLPQINDQPNTRGVTPEVPQKNFNINASDVNIDILSDRVLLPNLPSPRQNTKQTNSKKGRENAPIKTGTTMAKKKKKRVSYRSASAEKDKRVPDHLNDVPTLISLNYEKDEHFLNNTHHRHLHGNELNCPFGENCEVHSKQVQKN